MNALLPDLCVYRVCGALEPLSYKAYAQQYKIGRLSDEEADGLDVLSKSLVGQHDFVNRPTLAQAASGFAVKFTVKEIRVFKVKNIALLRMTAENYESDECRKIVTALLNCLDAKNSLKEYIAESKVLGTLASSHGLCQLGPEEYLKLYYDNNGKDKQIWEAE